MAITNMSGYTYRFFGNLTEASEFDYTFNFICNDKKYTRILFSPTDALLYFTEDGDVIPALTILDGVYEWVDDAFMMFDIIDGRDVANAEAIEILSGLGEFTLTEDEKDVFVKGAYKWNNTIERPTQTLTFSNFKAYNKTFTGDVAIDVLDDLYGIVDINTGIGLYLNTVGWLDGSITLNELLSGSTPVASDIYQIWDFGEGTYLKNKAYKYLVANSEVYEIPEETKPVVLTLKDELVLATSENQLLLLQPSDYDVDFPVKFTLYLDNVKVASFEFEFNMTWEQFINSKYNTENYFYTKDDNKVYYRYDNYVIENQTIDSIILQQDYTLLELEPPTEEDEPIIPDVPDEPIEPEEPTIMNFVIKVDGAFDGIYSFEKGMTWQEFVESDYNSAGYFTVLDDINYVIYRNEFIVKNVIYTSVIENKEYDTFKELEEPDIPDLPDIPDVPTDAIVKLKKMMENISSSLKYKLGTSEKINAQQFSNKILDIQTGVQVEGTKNISENGSYDVSTYAIANVNVPNIVNGVPIEISSLDSSLLIAENENKLYRYGGEIYKVVVDKSKLSLVGATISVPSGWSATLGYGNYNLLGTFRYNGNTYVFYNTSDKNCIIGAEFQEKVVVKCLHGEGGSRIINNTYSFTFNITGGADTTNQTLQQWIRDNNGTITGGTYDGYIFQKLISPSGTKQITANDTYDIKEYESVEVNVPNIINGIPIEIPSLDSSYLIEENQGKIYKCDGKLYRVVEDVNAGLSGKTITLPANFSVTSGYGKFNIFGSFTYQNTTYPFANNLDYNVLIGFDKYGSSKSNLITMYRYDAFNNKNVVGGYGVTLPLIFNITGGTDANNEKLKQWFINNNATFTGDAFIFQEILSPSGTLEVTENGEVDVKSYEKVNVNVASSGGNIEGMNTVNFKVDGVNYASYSAVEGQYISAPKSPTKDEHMFNGWSLDGVNPVSFPYLPTESSTTFTALLSSALKTKITGLGNQSPTSQAYFVDDNFPTSFEEVTDKFGNIFIKIPTMYRKVEATSNDQITSFTIATGKYDDTYEPYSVFVRPNGTVMDYVLIGKYTMSSTTLANSTAASTTNFLIGDARALCQSRGTGYQQYDWQFQKLFVDLCLAISKKVDFNSGTTIENYLGIYDLDKPVWIDGVSRDSSTWCIAYDPSKYVSGATSSSTGYVAASYTAPTTSSVNITKLGYDESNPFFNYPNTASGSSYTTYYCDGYGYYSGNHPVYSYVGYASAAFGLWYCYTDADWSNVRYARLCYRPLDESI